MKTETPYEPAPIQRDGSDLLMYLVPFGRLDLACAETILYEADISYREFGDYVDEFMEDTQIRFLDLDFCGMAYELILQEVRSEIEQATGIDICNDTEIYAYSNFSCSMYDRYDAAHDAALEVEEECRSQALQWFIDNTQ